MKTLKHIGKMKNTGAKVLVVFRTLPGESNQSLVIAVSQLPDSYHDAIMAVVESDQAQDVYEFGEILFIRSFPDGRPMLTALQQDNRLQKVPTDLVIMTPSPVDQVPLDQLNLLIAEQKNCTVDDLTTFVKGAPKKDPNAPEGPKTAYAFFTIAKQKETKEENPHVTKNKSIVSVDLLLCVCK